MSDHNERISLDEDLRDSAWPGDALISTQYGVIISDLHGRVVWLNPAATRMTGWGADAAIGQPLDGIFSPGDSESSMLSRLFRQVLRTPIAVELAHSVVTRSKEGEPCVIGCGAAPVRDRHGEVTGVIFILWDDSYLYREQQARQHHARSQQRAEAAYRESEDRYRAFLKASAEMVFVKDTEGRYVMVNPVYAAFLGKPADEILGRADDDLMSQEAAQASRNSDIQALGQGDVVVNNEIIAGRIYETRKFPVSLGGTTGVGGMMRDITEQTLVQQELRRSEMRLRSIVRILQHPAETVRELLDVALGEAVAITESKIGYIFLYDEDVQRFSVYAWSSGVSETCGVPESLIKHDLADVGIWGEPVRQRRPIVINDFQAPHPLKKGYPDGHAPVVSFMTVPVFDGERIVAVVGVANKVTDYTDVDVLQLTLLMSAVWRVVDRKQAEEALERERANLASVLAACPIAMMVFGADKSLALANPAAEAMFGVAGQDMLGVSCGTVLACLHRHDNADGCSHGPACSRCPLQRALVSVLEDGPTDQRQGEAFVERDAGESIWVGFRANPVQLNGERQVVMSLDDITARKKAEEALAAERRLLRTVVDNLPVAVYAKDHEARKTLANKADLDNIGAATEADVLGRTDFDLFSEEVARRFYANDLHVLQTGEPILDCEELLVDTSGEPRWLSSSKFPLKNDAGEVIGLVGTGRDVTASKQAEVERNELLAQVEAQAQQVRQIIETVPQGVVFLDGSGCLLLTNPVADVHLSVLATGQGTRLTHLGRRPLSEFFTSPPHGLWHEVRVDDRVYEVIARPVIRLDGQEAWVMVISDATEEHQVRDQLQRQERLAAVGQLAAGIAHDFNNIMAVIVLHAQLISRAQTLSSRNRDRLSTIYDQARHATRLIEQILDFSRRSTLTLQTLDLHVLLNEQLGLLQRILPENIEVSLASGGEGRFMIDGDATRIQQLVMNLAINARDAMREGGKLRLELTCVCLTADDSMPVTGMLPGVWVCLSMGDTGTGIPVDVLPHIFDPFYTTKPIGQGSGLGLAQVHGIVGQHGGYVDVETSVGVGTIFRIYLPALLEPCDEADEAPVSSMPGGRGETVLVVEDSDLLREALVEVLTDWQYQVLSAGNGSEALEICAQPDVQVDLVLSDVVMPQMGGAALVRELRVRGFGMPVILMSGHTRDQDLETLQTLGVHAWLNKPPDLELLATTIAAALA